MQTWILEAQTMATSFNYQLWKPYAHNNNNNNNKTNNAVKHRLRLGKPPKASTLTNGDVLISEKEKCEHSAVSFQNINVLSILCMKLSRGSV